MKSSSERPPSLLSLSFQNPRYRIARFPLSIQLLPFFLLFALLGSAGKVHAQSNGWQLVWSDEFNGPSGAQVDPAKWTMETGGGGWGNNELESYTSRPQNAHLDSGSLVISAIKENYTGSDGVPRGYTSARLKTQTKFSQAYGRFEARLKIPAGQGLWPAFWMLGSNIDQVSWPSCGEIDIMENIGKEPGTIHGTVHGPGYSGASGIGAPYTLPNGQRFADAYHVYAVEWEPNVVRWYVDDVLYETRTPADLPKGATWVYDHPFFIIMNVAVGGFWPGNPDSTTVFPQQMLVDYVRVYKRGAATANPLDGSEFFVRQQYYDFLARGADDAGLSYWSGEIDNCGSDAQCVNNRRIAVADAFFFEPEFQQSGAFIYRVYKAALGQSASFTQFMSDRGSVVGGTQLDQSKTAYALNFVQRDTFLVKYPRTQTADDFVNTMLTSIQQNSGADLSAQRASLKSLYDGTDNGRAAILRQVADNQAFIDAEYNGSFVLMEYFGYLRRDPDKPGFDFWLGQVNKYPLRDVGIQHAMACSFITSAEYQQRFSSVVTYTNQSCPR